MCVVDQFDRLKVSQGMDHLVRLLYTPLRLGVGKLRHNNNIDDDDNNNH